MGVSRVRGAPVRVLLAAWGAGFALGQTYTIQTIAGGALPNGIPGTSASFSPSRTGVDAAGNVFIADSFRNVVYRLDAASGLLTVAAGNGTAGFSGDGGPATDAQLNIPVGVAVDASGSLYIADEFNQVVRKVSNGLISTVAGSGAAGFSGDNGPATSAELNLPSSVAVDASGNLYITDLSNNRVRKVSNGVITTVAGNGGHGYSGENGPATDASLSPAGVAVDMGGNLYVTDSSNERVYAVSHGVINTVAGNGIVGFSGDGGPANNAQLFGPSSVAVDTSGNLYIADSHNNRIRMVSNGVITTFAGNGTAGFRGDNGPATSAELNDPIDVAINAAGSLYTADYNNGRIRKVVNGVISTVANGNSAPLGENGPALSAELGYMQGVAVDASGNVYIADAGYDLIRKISNGTISTVAGNGNEGFRGDNGPATSAWLNGPSGVAVDAAGNLYIADTNNNRIREVSNGVITTVAGNGTAGIGGIFGPATSASVADPVGVAVDTPGNLYIAAVPAGDVLTVEGGSMYVFPMFDFDNQQTINSRYRPFSVALDAAGNLYVVDELNSRVLKVSTVDRVNGITTTLAGGGATIADGVPATSSGLSSPNGVAVDTSGNVYIAESGGNRIRKVSNGVITTIAGGGSLGFGGDGGPAANALLNSPSGIAVDSSFNVYFTDTGNLRVRMLTPMGTPCTAASVSPSILSAPLAGATLSVAISKTTCPWAVQGLPSWVTYSGGDVETGTGTINLVVEPNSGPARQAYLPIAGALIYLTQAGPVASIAPNGIVPLDSSISTIQPGSWASIFGSNLATGTFTWKGDFPTTLGDVSVYIDGKAAFLSFVSPTQITFQAPDDTATGMVNVTVYSPFGYPTTTVTLAPYAASLTLFDSRYAAAVIPTPDGSGAYGDGSYDLAGPVGYFSFNTRPVKVGEIVELYGVGFGPTNPPVAAGQAFSGAAPTASPVSVTIGGVTATVQFSGLTSAGVYQLNVVVPDVGSGDQPVSAAVNGSATADGIYVSVQ